MKIQIGNRQKLIEIDKRSIRAFVARLLRLLDCRDKEVSLTFVDDAAIRVINRQYLSKDRPTNVISFSLQEGEFGDINPDILGDVIISVETALRDAKSGNLTFDDEIRFLLIHGILHLMGYNHENTTRQMTKKMRQKEKELFERLTINDE
jgi:probable rRNA maturation factor